MVVALGVTKAAHWWWVALAQLSDASVAGSLDAMQDGWFGGSEAGLWAEATGSTGGQQQTWFSLHGRGLHAFPCKAEPQRN